MRNPFSSGPSKAEKRYQQDLARWRQMAVVTGAVDQALLRSQPPEALKLIGPEIEKRFSIQTKDCGQVFPIEEKDHAGRDVTRYYGDIRVAFKESLIPPTPIKLTKTIWHKDRAYLETQVPDHIQLERTAMKLGIRLPGNDE